MHSVHSDKNQHDGKESGGSHEGKAAQKGQPNRENRNGGNDGKFVEKEGRGKKSVPRKKKIIASDEEDFGESEGEASPPPKRHALERAESRSIFGQHDFSPVHDSPSSPSSPPSSPDRNFRTPSANAPLRFLPPSSWSQPQSSALSAREAQGSSVDHRKKRKMQVFQEAKRRVSDQGRFRPDQALLEHLSCLRPRDLCWPCEIPHDWLQQYLDGPSGFVFAPSAPILASATSLVSSASPCCSCSSSSSMLASPSLPSSSPPLWSRSSVSSSWVSFPRLGHLSLQGRLRHYCKQTENAKKKPQTPRPVLGRRKKRTQEGGREKRIRENREEEETEIER